MDNNLSSFKKTSTAWIFLVTAANDKNNNNDRHIIDLAWGLKNLLISGVKEKDIFIFIDSSVSKNNIDSYLSNLPKNKIKFNYKKILDFIEIPFNFFSNYQNLVFFVFGHGNNTGLDTIPKNISPFELTKKIRGFNGPRNAVLYLGQCYAGIFNYLDAGKTNNINNKIILTIIGATELQSSLSLGVNNIQLYNGNGKTGWCANIFMFNLFHWFSNPIDIDGDSFLSILDSYKYAEIATNKYLKNIAFNALKSFGDLHGMRSNLQITLKAKSKSKSKIRKIIADIEAIESMITQEVDIFTIKQESWLLNANHARIIGL